MQSPDLFFPQLSYMMDDLLFDDDPSIQGFTPINNPDEQPQPLTAAKPADITPEAKEPTRKKRKQKENDLPSPPKTAKGAKKPKQPGVKAVGASKGKKSEQRASSIPHHSVRSVLSDVTISKLNAFRYNALPTPCSADNQVDGDSENLPPYNEEVTAKTFPDGSKSPELLLSSDLWTNQEPLPNFPWLYRASVNGIAGQTLTSTDDNEEPTGSGSFITEFLQTDMLRQRVTDNETFIDDNELERLFDDLITNDLNLVDFRPNTDDMDKPVSPVSVVEDTLRKSAVDEEDYPLDNDMLESLYEASSVCTSSPRKIDTNLIDEAVSDVQELDLDLDKTDLQQILENIELPSESTSLTDLALHRNSNIEVQEVDKTESISSSDSCRHSQSHEPVQAIQNPRARFARPPYPPPIQVPGPIPGLSSGKRILTCFRVGEAINATAKARKQGYEISLELYVRVIQSIRAGEVQTFRFVDLWSTPSNLGIILEGRWVGWKAVELWEKDSRVFFEDYFRDMELDEHGRERPRARKCRVIGSLNRQATGGWMLDIKNLWEAAWDDIAFAKQVVCELEANEDI